MDSIIIYTKTCLCSSWDTKSRLEVKKFAHALGLKVEVRRVTYNPKWKEEAIELSDLPIPYVYNPQNKQSTPLGGDLSVLI